MMRVNYGSKLIQQVWSWLCGSLETSFSGKREEFVKVLPGTAVATEPVIRGMETHFPPQQKNLYASTNWYIYYTEAHRDRESLYTQLNTHITCFFSIFTLHFSPFDSWKTTDELMLCFLINVGHTWHLL